MERKISDLLSEGVEILTTSSPSSRLDAEILLGYILNFNKTELVIHRNDLFSDAQRTWYLDLIKRRQLGEPIAYLIGSKEFFGRDFWVTPATLIPRPETEHLIEEALKHPSLFKNDRLSILDLGTGTGAIIITLILELRKQGLNVRGIATDISADALKVAAENAKKLGVADLIEFRQGYWWQPIKSEETFSIVVSNPPYISIHDKNVSPGTRFEPASALYAGEDGLKDYRDILSGLCSHLQAPALFLGEFGATQGVSVKALAEQFCPKAKIKLGFDLAGLERFISLQFG
jgi:release factor glutamine methyltransferase